MLTPGYPRHRKSTFSSGISTTIGAAACVMTALGAAVALGPCPPAQGQVERQCYRTVAGAVVCVYLGDAQAAERDCMMVPMGPGCYLPTTLVEKNGRFQLPDGEWATPLPREQWPPPGGEVQWPGVPAEQEGPQPTSAPLRPRPSSFRTGIPTRLRHPVHYSRA